MSEYLDIFTVRTQLDANRQPSFGDQLTELKSKVSPEQTPYDRLPEVRRGFMSLQSFAKGAAGRQALIPQCAYLYRATALTKVRRYTTWKGDRETTLQLALGELDILSRRATSTDGWVPLSEVAEGVLTSDRSFTWWSSHPISRDSVICDLHLRGMPNNWVEMHSLILRCSADRLLNAAPLTFIPTVIDGYDSLIFHATSDMDRPTCGSAISIEDPALLEAGADEFALKPIPVEYIDILPILIDGSLRTHKIEEIQLTKSLRSYYRAELER